MSFRQPKSDQDQSTEAWDRWIDQHRAKLQAIGLPPEVYLSESHWQDFLENGHLHWHPEDATGFSFEQLPPQAIESLRQSLESEFVDADSMPPLLGWLRARSGVE
jgi:hypothetical protein